MNRLCVQYASNLPRIGNALKPVAPVLALVSPPDCHAFLTHCSRNWDRVLLIGSRTMNQFPNITALDNNRVEHEGVSFVGGDDYAWLAHEIASSADMGLPTVVIAQAMPSASLMRPPVRAWIAGRAGRGLTYRNAANVMVCANPYGAGYCGELFVEISTEGRDGDCGDVRDAALVAAAGPEFGAAPREPSGVRPLAESDDVPAPQMPAVPGQSLHWV